MNPDRDSLQDRINEAERDLMIARNFKLTDRRKSAQRRLKVLWKERDEEYRVAMRRK